jgi:3-oxoacyl-[acyl-carrier protein] reductase
MSIQKYYVSSSGYVACYAQPEEGPVSDFSSRDGVALVSGGTGGVGAAVCRLLAERGCNAAFSYRANAAAADALRQELEGTAWTLPPSGST